MVDPILEVSSLSVARGGLSALRDVSFSLGAGETLGVLGANGAGKSTLLDAISGFLAPKAGSITLFGERIDGLPPHRIVRRGLLQVSQERDLFPGLSVVDNLKMGAHNRSTGFAAALARCFDDFPRLAERRRQAAGTLSGGEQQMLAIARALIAQPKVLLLDEPTAGLAPRIIEDIQRVLVRLKHAGLPIVLVEQNVRMAAKVVDRFVILRSGEVAAEGAATLLARKFDELVAGTYI